MSRIYWDTMLFIYWLEGDEQFSERVTEIYTKMRHRGDLLMTSAFALGELLAVPQRAGDSALLERIKEFVKKGAVEVIPFDLETVDQYTEIRAHHEVSSPDAIHLACAVRGRVDLFLTNDKKLIGKTVPGIQFVAGLDVNLF